MAEVHGTCDKRFDAVRVALAESLDDADVGASAAVFVDGEPVADLWGGYQDAKRTEPWEQDTITNVWSTTKTMVALSALILADRGDLDLDAPVASYWPEFAAAGKERVLVRHLLSHNAGLPEFAVAWPTCTTGRGHNTPRATGPALGAWRAGRIPLGHPGVSRRRGRRRVTGQSLATFFAEHIAKPLGADFHLTMPAGAGLDERFAPALAPPDAPDGDLVAAPPGDQGAAQAGRRSGSATGTAWPGGGRRSCRGAGTATRVRWRRCSRCSPAAAR